MSANKLSASAAAIADRCDPNRNDEERGSDGWAAAEAALAVADAADVDWTGADVGYGDKLEEDAATLHPATRQDLYNTLTARLQEAEKAFVADCDAPGAAQAYEAERIALLLWYQRAVGEPFELPAPPVSDAFEIRPIDFLQTARSGSGRVVARVTGYWSSDSITLYVERKVNWQVNKRNPLTGDIEGEPGWSFTVSHASGGRDPKVVEDDIEASHNFGQALIAMATYAKALRDPYVCAHLEQFYADERNARKARQAAEAAARQALVDADPALGTDTAKALVTLAIATMKLEHRPITIAAFERAAQRSTDWTINESRGGSAQIFCAGRLVTRAHAVAVLSEMSIRSGIAKASA